jgi:hypothetical protein
MNLPKFRLTRKTEYGDISVYASNLDELKAAVPDLDEAFRFISSKQEGRYIPSVATEGEGRLVAPTSESERSGNFGINQFAPNAVKKIAGEYRTAILLYESSQPMTSAQIAHRLSEVWKKVETKRVSDYLTNDQRYELPEYVIKEGKTYRLSTAGRQWVEQKIVPKLRD